MVPNTRSVSVRVWCAMGMIAVRGIGCRADLSGGGDETVRVEQRFVLNDSAIVELASFEHGVSEPFAQLFFCDCTSSVIVQARDVFFHWLRIVL